MREIKSSFWKTIVLSVLTIVLAAVWRVGDPRALEIVFNALGWAR